MGALSYLNKYFLKYKWRLVLGVIFVTISNVFAIVPPQLIRHALDMVTENIDTYRLFEGFAVQEEFYSVLAFNILVFGALVLLMALLKGIFMFFMRQTIIVMSRFIEYDLKNEVFAHYQDLEMSFYNRNNTGDLMNRISEDVGHVRMYVGPAIMYSINTIVMFILVIMAMVNVNLKLTLFVLLPLPILSFVIYIVQELINKKSKQVQAKLSDLSTFVQESVSGIRVLKTFVREAAYSKQFTNESEQYEKLSLDLVKINAFFFPMMLMLIGLSTLLTIFIGGMEVINGNISIGNIAEFIIYVNMLTWPVASLGWVVSIVQRSAASQQRINEFLLTKPEIQGGTKKAEDIRGDIEFRNVSMKYPDSGIVALDGISFRVPEGHSIAITGRTGSGKTTLANLVTRLLDPTSGSVLVDGVDIRKYDLRSLRQYMGFVPQDVFLFSDTIRNNIAFGLSQDFSDDELQEQIDAAAMNAAIYDDIQTFPKGYETELGERGITLSGGQKQRLSIARALIRNPRILVFDDCLSAVDTKTEGNYS